MKCSNYETFPSITLLITWIDGSPNDPPKRIPGTVVKPVVEIVISLLHQVLCCSVVKIPDAKSCYVSNQYFSRFFKALLKSAMMWNVFAMV